MTTHLSNASNKGVHKGGGTTPLAQPLPTPPATNQTKITYPKPLKYVQIKHN